MSLISNLDRNYSKLDLHSIRCFPILTYKEKAYSVPHGNIRMLVLRKNIHESAQTYIGYSYNYIQDSLTDQQVKCIRATEILILQLKAISNRTHKCTLIQYYIYFSFTIDVQNPHIPYQEFV